jgi:predicted ATPase
MEFSPTVTYFIGENGSGKSTVVEAIAVAMGFNAEGGSKNFNFGTRVTHSDLYQYLGYTRSHQQPKDGFFLRAESFYNVATNIDEQYEDSGTSSFRAYGGKSLHEQSHGESFMSLLFDRFFGGGLYILDEPEAALSPTRQLSVLSHIHQLVQQQSQFIIATHSPILMAYPGALIYEFSETGYEKKDYKDTEHYKVTKMFLDRYETMVEELFREG